jgi:hypothetical protein
MYLQLFIGLWSLLQCRNLFLHRRYDSLDWESACRKAVTYTQDNTNTDMHALSGIQTHDPSVRASEDSSCLRPRCHSDQRRSIMRRENWTYALLCATPMALAFRKPLLHKADFFLMNWVLQDCPFVSEKYHYFRFATKILYTILISPTYATSPLISLLFYLTKKTKLNSVVLVRKRTIPTERPQPAGEVSESRGQRNGSPRP